MPFSLAFPTHTGIIYGSFFKPFNKCSNFSFQTYWTGLEEYGFHDPVYNGDDDDEDGDADEFSGDGNDVGRNNQVV